MNLRPSLPSVRPSAAPVLAQAVATAVGPYELLGLLGRGGMATVYRAKHRVTGALCALKWLPSGNEPQGRSLRACFEREYQTLRGLRHPRIIQVFDYGVCDGGIYYTMELLAGTDLKQAAPLPWRATCQYLRDVATSLSLLHARRLVHRDVTPGNVRLTEDGHCKLLDFGTLMDFGRAEQVIGTPPFVAPEALAGAPLDQRVDLYALGALGYYCLTGTHAFPARSFDELYAQHQRVPTPPAELDPQIPAELSALICALLREDPLARPSSAAEVITRVDGIASLPPEADAAERMLVQSFLAVPLYVGRSAELARAQEALESAAGGRGVALRVEARQGSGRTRFLEELALRAQLRGAVVVMADGSAQHGPGGLSRAIAHALLDRAPDEARSAGASHLGALVELDPSLAERGGPRAGREPKPTLRGRRREVLPSEAEREGAAGYREASLGIDAWLADLSERRTIVLLVDNSDDADDASLAALLAVARRTQALHILLVVVEQGKPADVCPMGIALLRQTCLSMSLEALTRDQTAQLVDSLFDHAPHATRLSEWLHAQTGGSPLHCMGVVRELVEQGLVRHRQGSWLLPDSLPEARSAMPLEEALLRRLAQLSADARALAESLSVARVDCPMNVCQRLLDDGLDERALDELMAAQVLCPGRDGVVFTSAALRRATTARLEGTSLRLAHLRFGRALSAITGSEPRDLPLRIEAGHHLIRGGEDLRGASLVAEAAKTPLQCAVAFASLYRMGAAAEAALAVYRRARRPARERLPLLTLLAQAGYYEHYRYAQTYGDEALDVAEDLSGLRAARKLRRFVGSWLALAVGLLIAYSRHLLTPRAERGGKFYDTIVHLTSIVTTLCGVAVICLDPDRCDRLAAVMSPAACLPRRATLFGIYQFCTALQYVARERPVEAFAELDVLAGRFAEPGYYRLLPAEAHVTYHLGCHFGRGALAMMRADQAALESADVLERSGLALYMMIGSQLRYLYYVNRGELQLAQPHQAAVELHAARAGSAWQVELWGPVAKLLFAVAADDVVELTLIRGHLERLAVELPSLGLYAKLAALAVDGLAGHGGDPIAAARAVTSGAAPRSFIGWSTTLGAVALLLNRRGDHSQALSVAESALADTSEHDLCYVSLFLLAEIQAAAAAAKLGQSTQALARLQRLLERYATSEHPFALGLLHEAVARIAALAGQYDLSGSSVERARRYLRATGAPLLIARADTLAHELDRSATPREVDSEAVRSANHTLATRRQATR
jgi:Protein kinase domain/AAA ATPase domain